MTIGEIVRQGLYYARTCRSLWLFGFFVGLSSGGSGGSSKSGGGSFEPSLTLVAIIAVVVIVAAVAAMVMRFIAEGALIEGIVRARQGGAMTTREGFRAGRAHWGVLVRIALIYGAVVIGSLILLAVPCAIVVKAFGPLAAVALGIPALFVAVPWLITVYVVQAFAARIAVLENRQALDAIAKARLFLHGRLRLSLKLIVAALVGTLAIALLGLVTLAPVALLLVSLIPVLRIVPVIVLGCLVLFPAAYVLTAMIGTFRSSVWTIGYLTQVES